MATNALERPLELPDVESYKRLLDTIRKSDSSGKYIAKTFDDASLNKWTKALQKCSEDLRRDEGVEDEIDVIKNAIVDALHPEKVYLFGSFANGTQRADSDFDFYVMMPDGSGELDELATKAYRSIRGKRKRPVDIVVGTRSGFERRKSMTHGVEREIYRKGVLLYCG